MLEKRQIAKNIILSVISYGITLAITFILTPYLINHLGIEAYSFFPLAGTIIGYSSILTIAINSMANRFIAVAFHKGDYDKAKTYFVTIFVADIVLAIAVFIAGILGVVYLEKIIQIPDNLILQVKWLFFFVLMGSMISLALTVYKSCTFVKNRIDIDAYIKILVPVIRAVILIVFFILFDVNLLFLGIATLMISTFEAGSYVLVKRKVLPEIKANLRKFKWCALKEVLSAGAWNVLSRAKQIMLVGMDLYLANLFLGPSASGSLAIVKSLTSQIDTLLSIVSNTFTPTLTKTYSINENKLKSSYEISFIPLYLIGSIILGGIVSLSDIFYSLWVPKQDSTLLSIVTALTIGSIFISYGYRTLTSVFVIKNKLKLISIVETSQSLLSIILTILLLKYSELGIYAIAGVSSIITIISNFSFLSIYISKLLKQKWYTVYLYSLKSLLCLGIVIGIGYIVRNIIYIDSWIKLFATAAIIAVVSFAINLIIVTTKSQRRLLYNKALEYVKINKK